jgi:hypothetical protein
MSVDYLCWVSEFSSNSTVTMPPTQSTQPVGSQAGCAAESAGPKASTGPPALGDDILRQIIDIVAARERGSRHEQDGPMPEVYKAMRRRDLLSLLLVSSVSPAFD